MAVRGWVQGCEWQRRGSELTADVAEDGIVLTIEDLSDFDDAGGILSLNDQTISYDSGAVDEDASTILVNTGLAAAATEGDPVFTVAGGQVLQDVVLFVDCGDGDLVEVRVPFAQRDYWPEGDYDDPVLVTLSDDLETVLDAPGRVPTSSELAEARGGYGGTLQDIYDAADAAAEAAADAAANATVALSAANGKNTVWVSLSSPGTTPNVAGDTWFRKESLTQTVIEQWFGLGGTSWQQVTLNNQVIANLDAGKLVAGSAFTNALSVKTNLTLGDASTNGVIQTYNFAGSSVGVYIDKFGLVAKGGSIAGATITGGSVSSSSGGLTLTMSGASLGWSGSGSASITDTGTSLALLRNSNGLQIGSSGVSIAGLVTLVSGFNANVDMNSHSLNEVTALNNGGGDITMDATIKPDECYLTNLPASSGGTDVQMGGSGRLFKLSTPSLYDYKTDIGVIDVDPDALAQLVALTWHYRNDVPFDVDDFAKLFYGYMYDDAAALGLTDLISEGEYMEARPERLPLVLLAAWSKSHQALRRSEQQIADLTARIDALEAR